ncbi:hypothetical protein ACIBEJ_15300 [Nonomuraea sp. NPDC050790]|uniref:hypothetical protein n=1 Tax=Nonomuraea sp. NPDC050790 TaxID=3364371 RepID=UPI00379EA73D
MDLVTVLMSTLLSALWQIFRRPILLGLLILGFLLIGIGTLWASTAANGWWQDFLLNAGVNLIFVGAVDLLILSVIARGLLQSNPPASPEDRQALELWRIPLSHLQEVSEALRAWQALSPDTNPPDRPSPDQRR